MGSAKPHDPRLTAFARENRKRSTIGEAQLWHELRGHKLCGVKFRRQHVFEPFVLDFFAPSCGLTIEVDGDSHDDPIRKEKDASRQQKLEAMGIRVLRFSHERVIHDMDCVLQEIAEACGVSFTRNFLP
ncbi:MAG TPA: endonuclease domain-containing protein [Candidatus Kapabacteria bacterium]|jgi:very-short-patch-repair endonuclease|nr:endonuclease domain-containing protein [Candidatus Kapabacteria bacterium]